MSFAAFMSFLCIEICIRQHSHFFFPSDNLSLNSMLFGPSLLSSHAKISVHLAMHYNSHLLASSQRFCQYFALLFLPKDLKCTIILLTIVPVPAWSYHCFSKPNSFTHMGCKRICALSTYSLCSSFLLVSISLLYW